MKYKGYDIRRVVRETSFGKYSVYVIHDTEGNARETAVSIEVAQHVIDAKVAHGQWPDLEVKQLAV